MFSFPASDRSELPSAVYRELPPQDFFTFTIPFSMKGSTDVSIVQWGDIIHHEWRDSEQSPNIGSFTSAPPKYFHAGTELAYLISLLAVNFCPVPHPAPVKIPAKVTFCMVRNDSSPVPALRINHKLYPDSRFLVRSDSNPVPLFRNSRKPYPDSALA